MATQYQRYKLDRHTVVSETGETQADIRLPRNAEIHSLESFGGPETTFVLTVAVPVDDAGRDGADSDEADSSS